MSVGPAEFVARQVHDLVERQRLDALPDRELLSRFLAARDEDAFAALVRRHGPMVFGACRRVLRQAEDAEDACQATFLVLARKAGAVRDNHLTGWLHRVAVRVALRLRRDLARRKTDALTFDVHSPERTDDMMRQEVLAAFDEEVGRLPRRLRLPLVMCCMQGLSRNDAAKALGWSLGAVRGRLERGRKLLQARFARKGLTLTALALPAIVEQTVPAVAAPTSAAARLADAVVRSMAIAKAKLAAWSTAALLCIGMIIGMTAHGPAGAQPGDAPKSRPVPAPLAGDAEKNLDTFVLRVSLAPKGEDKFDPRFSLYHVLLYVPNLRLEPPANGPDGKPIEAHARITKEQAKKIVAELAKFDFFAGPDAFANPQTAKLQLMQARDWPHAGLTARFQNGEDAARQERLLAWLPTMLPPLDAVRASVDGEAGKALDQLLGQLAEERKRWQVDLDADLRKLQGTWAPDLKDIDKGLGGIAADKQTMKCVIDGKKITLKPQIRLSPLMDIEVIRGTFDLKSDKNLKTMTITGNRDTVAKIESGTWTLLYEVTDSTLTLLLPPAGKAPSADGKPRWELGDRQFLLQRVPAGIASEWGVKSEPLQSRIRTPKLQYATDETPVFDLDVRDPRPGIAGKANKLRAPRIGVVARVQVDGVWYRAPDSAIKKLASFAFPLGETVDRWATVTLDSDFWLTEGADPKVLVLTPGKHTVRIGFHFGSLDLDGPTSDPISGPLEIEIVAPVAKGVAPALTSKWGDESDGLSARIRAAKARYRADHRIAIDYDVTTVGKTDGRSWSAGISGHYARVEVDGVWYVYKYETWEYPIRKILNSGKEVAPWTTVLLSSDWVREDSRRQGPQVALDLKPGKHTIRVSYDFSSDASKPPSARPISGALEIEIVPATPDANAGAWREKKSWKPFDKRAIQALAFSPDGKQMVTSASGQIAIFDMTGAEPREVRRIKLAVGELLGFDPRGELVFLRRFPNQEPGGRKTIGLTVTRESDIDKDGLTPIFAVEGDTICAVALSRDALSLAVLVDHWNSINVIDLRTGNVRTMAAPKTTAGAFAFPVKLAFAADGKSLVAFGSNGYPVGGKINGSAAAWDVETGAVQWYVEEQAPQAIGSVSGDGKSLVSGGMHAREVIVWDAATGNKRDTFAAEWTFAAGLSADGKTVAFGTQVSDVERKPHVVAYDVATGRRLLLAPTSGSVKHIVFHPAGNAFVTADQSGELRWWVRE